MTVHFSELPPPKMDGWLRFKYNAVNPPFYATAPMMGDYKSSVSSLREAVEREAVQRKRRCPYCHRTKQEPGHKSCDGCGAPR